MVIQRKRAGAYYTPDDVAQTLVRWAVHRKTDRMLDPSCGDGRFLKGHSYSFGVERDGAACKLAREKAPWAQVHEADFFDWVNRSRDLFDCAAGNPPFIRYQHFDGETRNRALALCRSLGADFSGLTSSWAPFLVATCAALRAGGRIAFVVPAEIGHAPYAKPLIKYLCFNFNKVHLVAIKEKLFPTLSEDAWLLYADGYSGHAREIRLTATDCFESSSAPPERWMTISLAELDRWNYRIRPFLISDGERELYQVFGSDHASSVRLGALAKIGIGYVTGANDFFHLRPSEALRLGIDRRFTMPSVRSARGLPNDAVTPGTVTKWMRDDAPALLLRLNAADSLPIEIRRYLDSADGREARTRYKCRNRDPWYVVPDVHEPDGFLAYMSGKSPALVANRAGCACANAVHAVNLRSAWSMEELQRAWKHPLAQLSCELEGHPLGGGMLKLEPGEAARVLVPQLRAKFSADNERLLDSAVTKMRAWRHYA
jgi:hypothetical protein